MTFAEYNTDDNYDNKNGFESSLDELVKIGVSEGKTDKEIKDALSPKWQKSKKMGEFDNYYKKYTTPQTEEKVTEKVTETPKAEEKKVSLDAQTEDFMNKQNNISYSQEDAENKRQAEELSTRWDARLANIDKMSNSMKNIDDHFIDQLPTFMLKRYTNGEFGDPKSKDAKLRLSYFLLNGVQNKLKQASNLAMANAGKSPQFADTTSDYEKYQATNLEEGMANRWNKYKQETQSAIDLAKQGGMSEEALTDSIATISSNNRLQSAFNQMNERQKVFALKVLGEVGNKMGNMNDTEFANTLIGMSAMGDSLDYKEAAGMLIYRFIKDPEKRNAALAELGLLNGGGTNIIAGLGGSFLGGGKEEEGNKEDSTLSDGTNVDAGKFMTNEDYNKILNAANKLSQDYYDGKITEEEFRADYKKLEDEMAKHDIYNKFKNIKTADKIIKKITIQNLTT